MDRHVPADSRSEPASGSVGAPGGGPAERAQAGAPAEVALPPECDPQLDQQLVRGFLARQPDAVRAFAQRLERTPKIAACINRRYGSLLDAAEVEDLAHDVCAIAILKAGSLPVGAPLDAWLYRICALEARNAFRRKRRRLTAAPGLEEAAVDRAIEQLELQEVLFRALERLPGPQAEVIRLHHLQDLTLLEVARRLGCSENVVKGRYYRGIDQMRTELGGTAGGLR